jgi:hypothetical protein
MTPMGGGGKVDPEEARAWARIFRDFTIVVVGAFMLVYETVVAAEPNAYLIGAGLAALGLPPAFRLDEHRSKRAKEES